MPGICCRQKHRPTKTVDLSGKLRRRHNDTTMRLCLDGNALGAKPMPARSSGRAAHLLQRVRARLLPMDGAATQRRHFRQIQRTTHQGTIAGGPPVFGVHRSWPHCLRQKTVAVGFEQDFTSLKAPRLHNQSPNHGIIHLAARLASRRSLPNLTPRRRGFS